MATAAVESAPFRPATHAIGRNVTTSLSSTTKTSNLRHPPKSGDAPPSTLHSSVQHEASLILTPPPPKPRNRSRPSSPTSPNGSHVTTTTTTTAEDDGSPTSSPRDDLLRALSLIEDERHLVAYDLYRDARNRVELLGNIFRRAAAAEATEQQQEQPLRPPQRRLSPMRGGGGGSFRGGSFRRKNMRRETSASSVSGSKRGNLTSGGGGGSRRRLHIPGLRHHQQERQKQQKEQQPPPVVEKSSEEVEYELARTVLEERAEEFETLEKRALHFQRAKQNLTIDDDWTLAQTLFGITTYYRREDDASLSIKLEGEVHGIPLFEQLAVLRESDLFHLWAPFCTKSRRLAQLGKIDVVAWFVTGVPMFGLTRDACFRAIGCDCMREDGSIMLVGEGVRDKVEDGVKDGITDRNSPTGKRSWSRSSSRSSDNNRGSINAGEERQQSHRRSSDSSLESDRATRMDSQNSQDEADSPNNKDNSDTPPPSSPPGLDQSFASYLSRDAILDTIEIPPIPTKYGSGRMTIRSFQGVIDVLSPTSARTRIVANIDPNLRYVPQTLIDFCMKKMCGVLLSRLQSAAKKTLKDPIKNPHARRMREDVGFYQDWLLPKFGRYCEDLGWDMPPVGALTVREEDLEEEELILWDKRRSSSFNDAAIGVAAAAASRGGLTQSRSTVSEPPLHGPPPPLASSDRSSSREGGVGGFNESGSVTTSSGGSNNRRRGRRQARGFDADSASVTSSILGLQALPGPVGTFFAEREHKRTAQKEMEISAARRRAARRLKPVEFNIDQKKRLMELKKAKRDHEVHQSVRSGGGSVLTNSFRAALAREVDGIADGGDVENSLIVGGKVGGGPLNRLKKLDPLQSLLLLFGLLFWVLFSEMLGLYQFLTAPMLIDAYTTTWWFLLDQALRNVLTASLLGGYFFVHWKVIDRALMYTFDHIEMGQKTGSSGRKMFMETIRFGTKVFSSGIVVLSVGRGIVVMLGRLGLFSWHYVVRKVAVAWEEGVAPAVGYVVPDVVETVASMALSGGEKVLDWSLYLLQLLMVPILWLLNWINRMFLENNLAVWALEEVVSDVKFLIVKTVRAYVTSVATDTEGESLPPSWRGLALDSARYFMSYSAFFLLSVMLLANVLLPPRKKASSSSSGVNKSLMRRTGSQNSSTSSRSDSSMSRFSNAGGRGEQQPPVAEIGRGNLSRTSSTGSNAAGNAAAAGEDIIGTPLRLMTSKEDTIYEEEEEQPEDGERTNNGNRRAVAALPSSPLTLPTFPTTNNNNHEDETNDIGATRSKRKKFRVRKLFKRRTGRKNNKRGTASVGGGVEEEESLFGGSEMAASSSSVASVALSAPVLLSSGNEKRQQQQLQVMPYEKRQ